MVIVIKNKEIIIDVGMYVRTKHKGILQFLSQDKEHYYFGKNIENIKLCCLKEELSRYIFDNVPSYDLIDLIQSKDLIEIEFYSPKYRKRIVRLFEVEFKSDNKDINFQNAHCSLNMFNGIWSKTDKKIKPIIKTILTKEQFEANSYKVGE